MAKTALADIIIPSVFEQYSLERTAAKSLLISAGIVEVNAHYDSLAAGSGKTVNMPFWQDVTPARQILKKQPKVSKPPVALGSKYLNSLRCKRIWSSKPCLSMAALFCRQFLLAVSF